VVVVGWGGVLGFGGGGGGGGGLKGGTLFQSKMSAQNFKLDIPELTPP